MPIVVEKAVTFLFAEDRSHAEIRQIIEVAIPL